MSKWTTEWPTEEGKYWFYGNIYADEKKELTFVQVYKTTPGVMCVANGHFIYKSCDVGHWQKMVLPELPA